MSKLVHGSKIGNATVISNDILSKGASIPGRNLASISYITMHNTGLIDVKANNFHRSLKRENALTNGRKASWTFTVDDIEIYQETPMNWETWHAGNSTGNKNSISIEMCQWSDKEKQRKTYDNAARLVAKIMKQYKLSIDKVVQHNKWSGKNCPEYLRAKKYGYDWNWFINLVKEYNNSSIADSVLPTTSTEVYTVIIDTDTLNIRSGTGTNYSVVGQVKRGDVYTIVETKNNWGKLKSGTGWISLDYCIKKDVILSNQPELYEILADNLNVRKGPGTNYEVISSVKKGDVYTIIEKENDFGKLKSGLGWISINPKYVKKK